MQDYNGIIKIKDGHGEHYTEDYVKWLESSLQETRLQLSIALNLKRRYESNETKDLTHYWDKMHDHDSYPEDDYDR